MGWLVQAECTGQALGRMLQVPPSYSSDTAGYVGGLRSILKLAGHLNQCRNLAQVIGWRLEKLHHRHCLPWGERTDCRTANRSRTADVTCLTGSLISKDVDEILSEL